MSRILSCRGLLDTVLLVLPAFFVATARAGESPESHHHAEQDREPGIEVRRVEGSGEGKAAFDGVIGEGEYRFEAVLGGGDFRLFWRVEEKTIRMALKAETSGFVAVGFGPSEHMKDADIVFGWVDDEGKAFVEDQFATGEFGPHKPDAELGGRSDILASGGSQTDGVTVIEFRRPLAAGDGFDKALSPGGETALIWSVGETDDPHRHHAKRGEATIVLEAGTAAEVPPLWPIHAALMDLTALVLIVSMFLARRRTADRTALPRHKAVGVVAPLYLLVGLGVAAYMVGIGDEGHLDVPHAWIGLAAACLGLAVPVLGLTLRKAPSLRSAHRWLGRLFLLGLLAAAGTGVLASGILGWP